MVKSSKVLRGSLWLILGWSLAVLIGCDQPANGEDEVDDSDIPTLTLGKSQLSLPNNRFGG
jgi:hypothetical protein